MRIGFLPLAFGKGAEMNGRESPGSTNTVRLRDMGAPRWAGCPALRRGVLASAVIV